MGLLTSSVTSSISLQIRFNTLIPIKGAGSKSVAKFLVPNWGIKTTLA